jgi:2-phosphosulfolactate phosphatase
VHIVCAGTDGHLTAEDVLFAGCLAHALRPEPSTACPDVQTEMARDYYVSRSVRPETFLATMRGSRGGQNLLQLGFDADIVRAATLDLFDIVPEWHRSTNEIVASDPPVRI